MDREDDVSRLVRAAISPDRRPSPEAKRRLICRLRARQAQVSRHASDLPNAVVVVLAVLAFSAILWLASRADDGPVAINACKLLMAVQVACAPFAAILAIIRRRTCRAS